MSRPAVFDPIAALQALDEYRVAYIVVGALGRVIHGSDEFTDGLDIVPSIREENLRRLGLALKDLNARRRNGKPPNLDKDLARQPVLELQTNAGKLKIVLEPAGTRGYDDLRRAASPPLAGGQGWLGYAGRSEIDSVAECLSRRRPSHRRGRTFNRKQMIRAVQRLSLCGRANPIEGGNYETALHTPSSRTPSMAGRRSRYRYRHRRRFTGWRRACR
jgi:hypothetical protein